MIKTRDDLQDYLDKDKRALGMKYGSLKSL